MIDGVLSGSTERARGAVAIQGYNILIRAVEAQRKIAEQDELLERIAALARVAGGQRWEA